MAENFCFLFRADFSLTHLLYPYSSDHAAVSSLIRMILARLN